MHLSNSYFRCNKSYKTCPVKGTITISFLFEKELFFKFVTLKTEITPWRMESDTKCCHNLWSKLWRMARDSRASSELKKDYNFISFG